MKTRIYGFMLLITPLVLLQCLPLFALNGQWSKTGESKGIVSYSRQSASGVYEIYSAGMVNAPIASIEALLRDVSARPQYVYGCAETSYADIPGLKNTADVHYIYNRTRMPAFMNDRDCVVKSVWTIDKASGSIYCRSESIDSDYRFQANVVRMERVVSQYTLIPRGNDLTLVICQAMADPGGSIPAFVVNLFTKSLGADMIEGIQKMANRPKYRNASIITSTPA
ncbi:MAG TPA: START domain-containing protein [Desulfomonilia bacterium]